MKKSRAPGIIAGVLFQLYGIVMLFMHLFRNQNVINGTMRLPGFLGRFAFYTSITSRDVLDLAMCSGGILFGVLMLVVFILISIGLFSDKRVLTAIGSGLGLLLQTLASFGVFYALERASISSARIIVWLKGALRMSFQWVLLLLNLLMLLVFLSLLISSLSRKGAGVFAWIGGGAALLRILPLGFLTYYLIQRRLRFFLSPLGVVLTLTLAAATVLAGLSLRQAGQRRMAAPAVPPHPSAPAAEADKLAYLRNFKQLLDEGVITEEEFEAKKKQLLGL